MKNNNVVFARKYRPRDFKSLIGQDSIKKILINSIKSGKIGQGFVLSGIRGVGKTTISRIIAMALNCTDSVEGEPCGKCNNCTSIISGSNIDVKEINAASNTGIDNIRETILDDANFMPIEGNYKVYILDEVHMLSKSAFNALLKILEEPPAHVKFIFATTELDKVPQTILSRCQRFALRHLGNDELIQHFKYILNEEGVKSDEESLKIIAKASGGSVRDGLTMLEQAVFTSNGDVNEEDVASFLGKVDFNTIFNFVKNILEGDVTSSIKLLKELKYQSVSLEEILIDIREIFWQFSKYKINNELISGEEINPDLISYFDDKKDYISFGNLSLIWNIIDNSILMMKNMDDKFQYVEMMFIKIGYMNKDFDVKQILSKVNELINSQINKIDDVDVKKKLN